MIVEIILSMIAFVGFIGIGMVVCTILGWLVTIPIDTKGYRVQDYTGVGAGWLVVIFLISLIYYL